MIFEARFSAYSPFRVDYYICSPSKLFFFLISRYLDGERLEFEDEKIVMEKLLAYHPYSKDKIGCGLDFIMVRTLIQGACYLFFFDLAHKNHLEVLTLTYMKVVMEKLVHVPPHRVDQFLNHHD